MDGFRVFLQLLIEGDAVPIDDIGGLIGVAPSRLIRKGEQIRPQIKAFHHKNKWILDYASDSNDEPEKLLDGLIKLLSGDGCSLGALSEGMDVCVFFAVYKKEFFPPICLRKDQVALLSDMGCRIDFDIY